VEKSVLSIPAASYAESSGTVVNVDGVEQRYEAALPLKGEALPHLEIIARLAKVLGQAQAA
jgi:NADH dehydrogenase/NADH:ubiquinone oxidoreductase subunit G